MVRLLNAYNYKGDILPVGTEITLPNEDVLIENGCAERITPEFGEPDYKKAAEEFFKENQKLKKLVDSQAAEIESLKKQVEELSKPQDGNADDANSQTPENLTPETPEAATQEVTPAPVQTENTTPGRVKK